MNEYTPVLLLMLMAAVVLFLWVFREWRAQNQRKQAAAVTPPTNITAK